MLPPVLGKTDIVFEGRALVRKGTPAIGGRGTPRNRSGRRRRTLPPERLRSVQLDSIGAQALRRTWTSIASLRGSQLPFLRENRLDEAGSDASSLIVRQ